MLSITIPVLYQLSYETAFFWLCITLIKLVDHCSSFNDIIVKTYSYKFKTA